MLRRSALGLVALAVLGFPVVSLAQRDPAPPAGIVERARAVARDRLHLSRIDGAPGTASASTLGAVRRDRSPGGRFAFWSGQSEFGTMEGDELERVWVVHFTTPAPAGTVGAIVVFDAGGHAVAGWELFSPD